MPKAARPPRLHVPLKPWARHPYQHRVAHATQKSHVLILTVRTWRLYILNGVLHGTQHRAYDRIKGTGMHQSCMLRSRHTPAAMCRQCISASTSSTAPQRPLLPCPPALIHTLQHLQVGKLTFRADFDSANLHKVEQGVTHNEFLLFTRRDCSGSANERATRTWFYFGVSGHSATDLVMMQASAGGDVG